MFISILIFIFPVGQAEYIEDIPDQPNQLFAAFVTAETAPGSTIQSIDTSEAMVILKPSFQEFQISHFELRVQFTANLTLSII